MRNPDTSVSPEPSAVPARAGLVLVSPHPRRRRRQPEPGGRQRRTARHREGLRLLADRPRPHRGPYSLGLAASVLWLGVLGDRYGRKTMLVLGVSLSVPACLLAAWAPSDTVLFIARLIGGISAGMAYPTTLALITALWSGQPRTRSIALWSAIGGAIAALGPLVAGALLEHFWWGSVFLVTLPLAAVALVLALAFVPSHVNETTDPVDNLGGILSVLLVGALILAINFAPVPNKGSLAIGLGLVAVAAALAFVIRQRRARVPLYDLHVAGRRTFWVAACAGIIVFGSLMGAMFIGQQYLQNVLGYHTLDAGLAILPAAVAMVLIAPRSAKLIAAKGSRFTLLTGYVFCFLGFLTMLILWKEDIAVLEGGPRIRVHRHRRRIRGNTRIPLAHRLRARRARRDGVRHRRPPTRPRRGHHAVHPRCAPDRRIRRRGHQGDRRITRRVLDHRQHPECAHEIVLERGQLRAQPQYQQYSKQIVAGAKQSFVDGQDWAYLAGIIAILLGATLVFVFFPKHHHEDELLATYHAEDRAVSRWAAAEAGHAGAPRVIRDAVRDSPLRATRPSAVGHGRHPTGLATCRYGTVGPSTALESMLMVTPP